MGILDGSGVFRWWWWMSFKEKKGEAGKKRRKKKGREVRANEEKSEC